LNQLEEKVKSALDTLVYEGKVVLHFTDGQRSNKGYSIKYTKNGYLYSWGRWEGSSWQSGFKPGIDPEIVLREKIRKGYVQDI